MWPGVQNDGSFSKSVSSLSVSPITTGSVLDGPGPSSILMDEVVSSNPFNSHLREMSFARRKGQEASVSSQWSTHGPHPITCPQQADTIGD